MKNVSATHIAAASQKVTRPGYLVQIDFSVVHYLSTQQTLSWDGHAWTAVDVRVDGITSDGKGSSGAKIVLDNADLYWSAYVLNEGVADKRIRIWAFDANAISEVDDFVPIFDGVGNTCEIVGTDVVINCVSENSMTQLCPRRFIGPQTGFNHLSPDQKKVTIGSTTVILERKN